MSLIKRPPAAIPPWRVPEVLEDAVDVAMALRELPAAAVFDQLRELELDQLVPLLMAAAALVDIDRSTSDLLAWETIGAAERFPWCSAGLHRMTPDNAARHRNGRGKPVRFRCKACDRDRMAARRAES